MKLPLLYTDIALNAKAAEGIAAQLRVKLPRRGHSIRIYKRAVKAGGARIDLWAIVARGRGRTNPRALEEGGVLT